MKKSENFNSDVNKIKVLELTDAFYPTIDGVVDVVNNCSRIINKQEKCSVAAPKPAKKENYVESDDFFVLRCASISAPEKYRIAIPFLDRKFRKDIIDNDYDVLHAHSPFTLGRFALSVGKKKKVPVVATLHTQYHRDFERVLKGNKLLVRFMLKYIIKLYNRADSVWTVSEASKSILRDYGYKGEIEVVRNGTDYVYPVNADELIQGINAEHNLFGQKNVFLFVGRLVWYKNLKLLCDALKILNDKNIDFKMIFVGGGFDSDEIISYVKGCGLSDKCIFTGIISDREKLQSYYLRSDLFLFPSTFDMCSVSKVEAAAHRVATVAVKNSCSAEQIVDGENGFLIDEDVASFADKLLYLNENPTKYKEVGENAYKTIYRSWDDVVEETLAKYKKVIDTFRKK